MFPATSDIEFPASNENPITPKAISVLCHAWIISKCNFGMSNHQNDLCSLTWSSHGMLKFLSPPLPLPSSTSLNYNLQNYFFLINIIFEFVLKLSVIWHPPWNSHFLSFCVYLRWPKCIYISKILCHSINKNYLSFEHHSWLF